MYTFFTTSAALLVKHEGRDKISEPETLWEGLK
jgi:hypothetical protein